MKEEYLLTPGETLLAHAWPCSPPPDHHTDHQGHQHRQPHDDHHGDDEDGALLTGGHCHCRREAEPSSTCSGAGWRRGAALVTTPMASLCPPEDVGSSHLAAFHHPHNNSCSGSALGPQAGGISPTCWQHRQNNTAAPAPGFVNQS